MSFLRNRFAAVAVALSLFAGGFAGGLIGATVASAVTSSGNVGTLALAASTTPSASPSTSGGKFVSNEDPTHEAGESAAREAQENAGQVPTVP